MAKIYWDNLSPILKWGIVGGYVSLIVNILGFLIGFIIGIAEI